MNGHHMSEAGGNTSQAPACTDRVDLNACSLDTVDTPDNTDVQRERENENTNQGKTVEGGIKKQKAVEGGIQEENSNQGNAREGGIEEDTEEDSYQGNADRGIEDKEEDSNQGKTVEGGIKEDTEEDSYQGNADRGIEDMEEDSNHGKTVEGGIKKQKAVEGGIQEENSNQGNADQAIEDKEEDSNQGNADQAIEDKEEDSNQRNAKEGGIDEDKEGDFNQGNVGKRGIKEDEEDTDASHLALTNEPAEKEESHRETHTLPESKTSDTPKETDMQTHLAGPDKEKEKASNDLIKGHSSDSNLRADCDLIRRQGADVYRGLVTEDVLDSGQIHRSDLTEKPDTETLTKELRVSTESGDLMSCLAIGNDNNAESTMGSCASKSKSEEEDEGAPYEKVKPTDKTDARMKTRHEPNKGPAAKKNEAEAKHDDKAPRTASSELSKLGPDKTAAALDESRHGFKTPLTEQAKREEDSKIQDVIKLSSSPRTKRRIGAEAEKEKNLPRLLELPLKPAEEKAVQEAGSLSQERGKRTTDNESTNSSTEKRDEAKAKNDTSNQPSKKKPRDHSDDKSEDEDEGANADGNPPTSRSSSSQYREFSCPTDTVTGAAAAVGHTTTTTRWESNHYTRRGRSRVGDRQLYPGDDYTSRPHSPPASDKNYLFYTNQIPSEPDGALIDVIHKTWWGDYTRLEYHHSFIQWLFPLEESGMNYLAQTLTRDEMARIKVDPAAQKRLVTSYALMLDFYGMHLKDTKTGEVERAHNWEERFRELNRSYHNYLRITRIIKCLGLLGLAHYQHPFVAFCLNEIFCMETLCNAARSCNEFWIDAILDPMQREDLFQIACEYQRVKKKKNSCTTF